MGKKPDSLNPSYIGLRSDILSRIPRTIRRVLDVGCSTGVLGKQIKDRSDGAEVTGIELDETMAGIAKETLDRVIHADIEKIRLSDYFETASFDCIIFADVLEHLHDPWGILKAVRGLLLPNGIAVASIPNVRHISTLYRLVIKGEWPYRDRGIHDKNHLRFFTKKNILKLFEDAGFEVEQLSSNCRIIEKPHPLNDYSRLVEVPLIKDFFTFQYIVVGKVKESAAGRILA